MPGFEHFKNVCSLIYLEEKNHIYVIRNEKYWKGCDLHSSTRITQEMFQKFNAKLIATNVLKSKKLHNIQQYGEFLLQENPVEALVEKWNRDGRDAANYGTRVHKFIETFFKYQNENVFDNLPEDLMIDILSFQQVYDSQIKRKWQPFMFEMAIFDRDYPIAGSVDALFVKKDVVQESEIKSVIMCDWKTSKKDFEFEANSYCKSAQGPFNFLPDCKLSRYRMQQNIYRYILEKSKNEYNVKVEEMYLCVLIKNEKKCKLIKIDRLEDSIIEAGLEYYFQKIKSNFKKK